MHSIGSSLPLPLLKGKTSLQYVLGPLGPLTSTNNIYEYQISPLGPFVNFG